LWEDDPHPYFPTETKWTVVADSGVAWRSSMEYNDRAAGKGPPSGTTFNTLGPCKEGDEIHDKQMWYIKAQVQQQMRIISRNHVSPHSRLVEGGLKLRLHVPPS
jgi:hypothetical protein